MNKIILMGRLTRDPELRTTQTGKSVAQFTLAVDRPFGGSDGKNEADFIPCVLWNKTAEVCCQYVAKGHRLLVEGRIQTRTYDDKQGQRRWVTECIGDRIEFIEPKNRDVLVSGPLPSTMGKYLEPQNSINGAQQARNSGMEQMGQSLPFDEEVPF